MATAVALWAGCGRAYHAAAVAVRTGIKAGNVQAHDGAADRVPEPDVDLIFKIGAAFRSDLCGCAAAPATAKDAGKNVTEAASAALPAARATKIREVKAAEVEALAACAPATGRRCSETACTKAAAARISLRRRGINIV